MTDYVGLIARMRAYGNAEPGFTNIGNAYDLLLEGVGEIEKLLATNAGLEAGIEQLHRIPEVIPLGREVELVLVLKQFMAYQISDYDRRADMAREYCEIRREGRRVLRRYGHECATSPVNDEPIPETTDAGAVSASAPAGNKS